DDLEPAVARVALEFGTANPLETDLAEEAGTQGMRLVAGFARHQRSRAEAGRILAQLARSERLAQFASPVEISGKQGDIRLRPRDDFLDQPFARIARDAGKMRCVLLAGSRK